MILDTAGLSSPGAPLPWVTLPALLCQKRLFISGFPKHCLPKVQYDKVDPNSGPRGWSYPAYSEMYDALTAGEVKIRRRPRGRRVLFHLLPTDSQLERGETNGTDSTLGYSENWLAENMLEEWEDRNPNSESLEVEPLDGSPYPSDAQRKIGPFRKESVWERFGKVKIEEDSDDDESNSTVRRLPDPPWKQALERITRPVSNGIEISPPGTPDNPENADDDAVSEVSEGSYDDEPDEVESLPLHLLLPSFLPRALQGKGRIALQKDDSFEWIPLDNYKHDVPPMRMIWYSSKKKWRLHSELREETCAHYASGERPIPDRVTGKILSKGVSEWNSGRGVWECRFIGRNVFGELRWAPDLHAWEWILADDDGRRKWVGRRSPDRDYGHRDQI